MWSVVGGVWCEEGRGNATGVRLGPRIFTNLKFVDFDELIIKFSMSLSPNLNKDRRILYSNIAEFS